jgi:hypothetical protein
MKSLCKYFYAIRSILIPGIFLIFPSLGWGHIPQAYQLLDDATGKPLIVLPSGEPELFFMVGSRLLFVGYNTDARIEQDDPPKGQKFPWADVGTRFKLRNENRWIRVEGWCCDDYSERKQQSTPAWKDLHTKLYSSADYDRFGDQWVHEFAGSPEATSCMPFATMPTFVIDPQTQKPKWIKYFAVARPGRDNNFKQCPRETWSINSNATVGSSIDSKSVLVAADDANTSTALLRVSVETGDILAPLTTDHKAIDFEDVERFKGAFLHVNKCPAFTASEMARKDRYKTTSAGRCMIQRRIRYEESVMRHFLGEPKPRLEN